MPEYIEREVLIRRIKEIHCAECDSYHGIRCRACWVDDTLDYIDSEPAADVAPVRHGRWEHTDLAVHWTAKDKCSECGYHSIYRCDLSNFIYCPNCGAKMDLEEK